MQNPSVARAYRDLQRLYQNPTREWRGFAAANLDRDLDIKLASKQRKLLAAFRREKWPDFAKRPALYFKALSLLYEVDDYRGKVPSVQQIIIDEHGWLRREIIDTLRRRREGVDAPDDYRSEDFRSTWKAKVLCFVAFVEGGRGTKRSEDLLGELRELEEFVRRILHRPNERPEEDQPAWTTLAFVHAAQARVARDSQRYSMMREKLVSVVECLDVRAANIIMQAVKNSGTAALRKANANLLDELTDDLVFVRRKKTLFTSFNVALAELQRGSLGFAAYAAKTSHLEFRLHGHLFHRLYARLLAIAIRRGQLSRDHADELFELEAELDKEILPLLEPSDELGNPKLYLYALRLKAVLQYDDHRYAELLKTLKRMENVLPRTGKWDSRIALLRARTRWREWVTSPSNNASKLDEALLGVETAFRMATGLKRQVSDFKNIGSLVKAINESRTKSLTDVMEALLSYGDVQIAVGTRHRRNRNPHDVIVLGAYVQAMKAAGAVIELAGDENPRLTAMGHLVSAESLIARDQFVEANQHLASAKVLEKQIDYQYVADRIRAVERARSVQKFLDLSSCTSGLNPTKEDVKHAQYLIWGWMIEHWTNGHSVGEIADKLFKKQNTIERYLGWLEDQPLKEKHPFWYQKTLLEKLREKRLDRTSSSETSEPKAPSDSE